MDEHATSLKKLIEFHKDERRKQIELGEEEEKEYKNELQILRDKIDSGVKTIKIIESDLKYVTDRAAVVENVFKTIAPEQGIPIDPHLCVKLVTNLYELQKFMSAHIQTGTFPLTEELPSNEKLNKLQQSLQSVQSHLEMQDATLKNLHPLLKSLK